MPSETPSFNLAAYLKITRPSNVVLFFLGILLGGVAAQGIAVLSNVKLWIAALSGTLIGAAANVINDVKDVDIDRINKPRRPLIAGELTSEHATRFWLLLNLTGASLSTLISLENTVIAITFIAIFYAYSQWFKRMLLLGNLVVASGVSAGLFYGASATGGCSAIWFPAIFCFTLNFGREILKDLEDVEGDTQGGASTLPIKLGATKTLVVVSAIFIALMGLSMLPYWTGDYGAWYLLSVMLLTNSIFAIVVWRIWQVQTKENFYRMNTLLKAAMLTGIISIALAKA